MKFRKEYIYIYTLSLRSVFLSSNSSIARARRASRALSSCSLKGQSLGIPGSFSGLFLRLRPSFFASFAFFLWCSFTFLMILCFFFRGTLLLLLSESKTKWINGFREREREREREIFPKLGFCLLELTFAPLHHLEVGTWNPACWGCLLLLLTPLLSSPLLHTYNTNENSSRVI